MTHFMFFFYLSGFFADWKFVAAMVGILGLIIVTLVVANYVYLQKVKYRAGVAPLCSWEYTAFEWQQYARVYDLGDQPKGAAKVKITPLDIWIADDSHNQRKELTEDLKCVTDCLIANGILSIRILWLRSYGKGVTPGATNFQLPIPLGKERDASRVVEHFMKNTLEVTEKLARITRHNSLNPYLEI
jgi:hypothetical protein